MPIYLQHGNLIVSKKALTEKYQGGITQFKHDFKDSELEECFFYPSAFGTSP